MLEGYSPLTQTFLGTLFTWGMTAVGAALVFCFSTSSSHAHKRKILDGSLGFAAGVMLAASYWSLLAPAIEMAEPGLGAYAFLPAAVGFALGALFVYGADLILNEMGVYSQNLALVLEKPPKLDEEILCDNLNTSDQEKQLLFQVSDHSTPKVATASIAQRRKPATATTTLNISDSSEEHGQNTFMASGQFTDKQGHQLTNWKRILLLIIAITVHNVPEGLAVGVGFGAVGKTELATFESARNLAIGIGLQNFPEGLAVSLPLCGSGYSLWKSFWYGQLSGMVEPLAGLLGVLAVSVAQPLLPYALSFAAGAMVYVVADDILPEAQTCGNGRLASWMVIVGFLVMMSLDVGLG